MTTPRVGIGSREAAQRRLTKARSRSCEAKTDCVGTHTQPDAVLSGCRLLSAQERRAGRTLRPERTVVSQAMRWQ